MPSPCVDAFQEALDNTKRVLFNPFEARKWSKLTLVYLLAGGSGGGGGGGGGGTGSSGGSHHSGNSISGLQHGWQDLLNNINNLSGNASGAPGTQQMLAIAMTVVLVGILALFVLLLMFVVSVFHFIFIECILSNRVSVLEYFSKYRRAGTSYFLWSLGFMVLVLTIVGVTIVLPAVLVYPFLKGTPLSLMVLAVIGWVLILVAIFAVVIAISVLTRDLALPIMIKNNISILPAWQLLFPRLQNSPLQAGLFLLIKMGFGVAVAILSFFALLASLLVCGVIFGIPAGIVYVAALALKVTASPILMLIGIIWLVAAIIALIFLIAAIMLPTGVFERSYNVSFLGRLEPEFALLPHAPAHPQGGPDYSPAAYS